MGRGIRVGVSFSSHNIIGFRVSNLGDGFIGRNEILTVISCYAVPSHSPKHYNYSAISYSL